MPPFPFEVGRRARLTGQCAALCAALLAAIACGGGDARRDASPKGALGGGPTSAAARPGPPRVALHVPSDSEIPAGALGVSIVRGRALLRATAESLPSRVRARLECVSCHPADGTQPNAMPWVGVYARFPQYRSRSGSVSRLEDRINDCFERSMNGRALDVASTEMRDIVAYLAFLSRGVPVGTEVVGQGLPKLSLLAGDSGRGSALYASTCVSCHGADGQGSAAAPPLWGDRSFNIGAGMARIGTAAAFIRANMPFDKPGSLTPEQAFDLAAYIGSRLRPDFPGKERDWPNGDPPPDVAYHVHATKLAAPPPSAR